MGMYCTRFIDRSSTSTNTMFGRVEGIGATVGDGAAGDDGAGVAGCAAAAEPGGVELALHPAVTSRVATAAVYPRVRKLMAARLLHR
ncbi:hypothetical protein Q0Z83_078130 [Actinoplanes sichuanensis]|nr:hypothetical protein Q0Z83_078130 [Actinoplanes sichuanensis]